MRRAAAALGGQRRGLVSRPALWNIGAATFYSARDAKRTPWSAEIGEKLCPYTSELVARGRALEHMVVGCCDKQPVDAEDRRRIDDSFLELVLPFSTDPTLRDSWLRSDGQSIRFGKLFELLDALAADVCYHHAGCESYTSENERYLVTASVDGVTASARIDPTKDLTLQAYLTYVGKSSMECTIDFISGGKQVGNTQFIMACRYKKGGAAKVHGLAILSDDQVALDKYARGQRRTAARRTKAQESLHKLPPNADEVAVMHALFLEASSVKLQRSAIIEAYLHASSSHDVTREENDTAGADVASGPPGGDGEAGSGEADQWAKQIFKARRNYKWMRHLSFRNTLFMNPQDRNVHGNIFGGYLMREAFELAWLSALCFFDGHTPRFKFCDDIQFLHPVPVGSVLEFNSHVVYAHDSHIVVQVEAFKLNPNTQYRRKTNELIYVFRAPDTLSKVKEVMPESYAEFVLYLEGRRALLAYLSGEDGPAATAAAAVSTMPKA